MAKLSQQVQITICGWLQNVDLILDEAGQKSCPVLMTGTWKGNTLQGWYCNDFHPSKERHFKNTSFQGN